MEGFVGFIFVTIMVINIAALMFLMGSICYDENLEDNSMDGCGDPGYLFIKVAHRHIWGKIYESESLNKAGKIFCEIAISIFCLPAIVLIYVFGVFSAIFSMIFIKLFCNKGNKK